MNQRRFSGGFIAFMRYKSPLPDLARNNEVGVDNPTSAVRGKNSF